MRHRKPMDAVRRECESGHVERSHVSEYVEPCESNQEVYTCDELHESWHPESPHPHGFVYFRASPRETEQRLPAPNEITGAEAKETDSQRDEMRSCEGECLCLHVCSAPGLSQCKCVSTRSKPNGEQQSSGFIAIKEA